MGDKEVKEDQETLDHLKSLTESYLPEINEEINSVLPSKFEGSEKGNYIYKLGEVLKNEDLNLNEEKTIFICLFRIQTTQSLDDPKNNIVPPFILYLLNKDNEENKLYFPNFKGKGNIQYEATKKINEIFVKLKKDIKYKGYLEYKDEIYIFFEFEDEYILNNLNFKNKWWWTSLFEIVNSKKVLNFPVHDTVYRIFYEKPFLISLFDENNLKIPIPSIGYFGQYSKFIKFIGEFGLPKENPDDEFGPFYYLTTYEFAGNYATWNREKGEERIENKVITINEDGKFKEGGIMRIAIFTGNINYEFEKDEKLNRMERNYDSLYIGSTDDYPILNPKYVIRYYQQLFLLSYHFVDTEEIDVPFFKLKEYNIK